MKTVKEIALEYADKLALPGDSETIIDFVTRFLAAVDAERGKDAVRYCYECGSIGETGEGFIDCCPDGSHAQYVHREIAKQAAEGFLSPAIPLGFALVPIDPSEEWITKVVRVNQPYLDIGCRAWREEVESLEYWHKAMIQAAGVTK